MNNGNRYKSLVGQRFGKLVVLEDVGRRNRSVLWSCQCDCGQVVVVRSDVLKSGNTKSCGCITKELQSIKAKARGGENHWNWKGGVNPITKTVRSSILNRFWRTLVFQRDNYTCMECNKKGGFLHAHHIKPFAQILEEYNITTLEEAYECEELWDINNGVTLCIDCHHKIHHKEVS